MIPAFDLTAAGFSVQNAAACALASELAYEQPPTISSPVNHILVLECAGANIIAFRGTHSILDWITDARCWFANDATRFGGAAGAPARESAFSPRRLHRGFDAAFSSTVLGLSEALKRLYGSRGTLSATLSNTLSSAVRSPAFRRLGDPQSSLPGPDQGEDKVPDKVFDKVGSPTKPLFFTGHSLGGAQAELAGYYFGANFPQSQVYTFGQPRVGNAAYAAECRQRLVGRHFRVVNQEDLIPRLPGVMAGYRHAGELRFISAAGEILENPSLLARLASDARGFYREYRHGHFALLEDHFLDRYREAIERLTSVADRTLSPVSI